MRALGRLITIGGVVLTIYSLFIPVIIMEFEMPAQEMGKIIFRPPNVQIESSLYNLGDRLADMENSGQELPSILNYLWLIFLILAILNFFLSIKPGRSLVVRVILALMPVALLIIVTYRTATDPGMAIGFDGLFDYLVTGYYYLLSGTLLILIGAFMICKPKSKSKN